MEVIVWNVKYKGDFSDILKKVVETTKKKKITVYYVCNWEELAKEIKKSLEKKGFEVNLKDFIGCERYKVDGDIVICDGEFHKSCFEGEFILVDPLRKFVGKVRNEKKKDIRVSYFLTKRVFGIIVSKKPGQFRLEIAKRVKKILEDMGKEAYIFVGDDIRDLENFPFVEVWINTACPRLKEDFKNVLNLEEFLNFYKENLAGKIHAVGKGHEESRSSEKGDNGKPSKDCQKGGQNTGKGC